MENSIDCLTLGRKTLPLVTDCNILTASENFLHVDRTAPFNVLIYVTDGKICVSEGSCDYEVGPGELLILKHGIRHYGKNEILKGTRWFYAHFLLDDADEGMVLKKKLCGLTRSALEEKLLRLCHVFHEPESADSFRVNMLLYDCLVDIGLERKPESEGITEKICAFLNSSYDTCFSEELVERELHLSYSHMAGEFKKRKGMTMGQYHNNVQMRRACQLLRSTLFSVGDISRQLGFSDMLYFSRKFHNFTGMSPTEYRKKALQEY